MDRRAGACSELEPRVVAGASNDRDDVLGDLSRYVGPVELLAGVVEPHDAEQGLDLAQHVGRDAGVWQPEHVDLALEVGVLEIDLEEESVELRRGKREDPLVLVRVLRRDDEEWIGQPMRLPVDRDLPLLHRLEERGLGARWCAVDLVGEQDVREDHPGQEDRLAHLRRVDADDHVRRRVGRELDAPELRPENVRHRAPEQRLRASGRAFDQDVALGERRDEKQIDGWALPDDDLADLLAGTVT